jgi:hypothetical protein
VQAIGRDLSDLAFSVVGEGGNAQNVLLGAPAGAAFQWLELVVLSTNSDHDRDGPQKIKTPS